MIRRVKFIVERRGTTGSSEEKHVNIADLDLPYEKEAYELMSAKGYAEYVKKHGYHFTDELAEHISKMMKNDNGKEHSWSVAQVKKAFEGMGLTLPKDVTWGDVTYVANMGYADLHPDVLATEADCLRYAWKKAHDKDGYEGMIFSRWTSDAIGKYIKIDWEHYV